MNVTTTKKIDYGVIFSHCIVIHFEIDWLLIHPSMPHLVITIFMVVKYTDWFSFCLLHPVVHYICTSVEFDPLYGYITF